MSFIIGVDVGGTCTDSTVIDEWGVITIGKALSTPDDFSIGVLNSIDTVAQSLQISLQDLISQTTLLLHSTTIAENAIVVGTGAKAGLIMTRGHEDTLVMTRGGYGRWSALTEDQIKHPVFTDKPSPIIPRSMTEGVGERTDYKGHILASVNEDEARQAVINLVNKGVESIGICLLWSFRNPANEKKIEKVIKDLYSKMYITLSSELVPILGEYERASSVALNAYLGPIISNYLNRLKSRLEENGFNGSLLVMQGYGGLLPVKEAAARAVGLIESGPAGGIIGCQFLGNLLGSRNVIACDMGGTTFKVGVIKEGEFEYAREPTVLRYHYLIPKIDIVSIGAGGGSIAWIEPATNLLKVGPESAGAFPGPVCYDFGGEEPTVTDVDLILGYIDPKFFLGGTMKLNKDKAIQRLKENIAEPLGMDVIEAAAAVYRITNSQIADLVRIVTVEQGLDPREFVLFAYGGAAPMHASTFGEELEVQRIIVPSTASVQGAFGLVASEVVHEYPLTHPLQIPVDEKEVNMIFDDLQQRAWTQLRMEGFKDEDIAFLRSIDIRYRRQVHEVTTPVTTLGSLTAKDLEDVYAHFEMLYEQKYGKGSAYREAGMEMITFRLRGIGRLKKPEPRKYDLAGADPREALIESRPAYFEEGGDIINTNFYDYDLLKPGNEISGPAVISTPVTTIVINPGQTAIVDMYKNISISLRR